MPILTKKQNKTPLGIYVHVPFCRSKCQYCDFYSLTEKHDKLIDGYLDATINHIKETGALAPAYKVDTIYFGGGTPSFFGADGIATILTTLGRSFDVDNNAEITIECNPDDLTPAYAAMLARLGFNRISMGVQSFCDEQLRRLGRRHTAEGARTAVHNARAAGFRNISIDLMFALPGSTPAQWAADLRSAIELRPEHISAYNLTYEENTPLSTAPFKREK